VLVIYHSHVASEAYPSPTDIRLSQWQGTDPPTDLYPGAFYVLVSLKDRNNPAVRAYQIHAGEVTEHPLEAV
jgi:proteasome lid subunit RPN8/RPN11